MDDAAELKRLGDLDGEWQVASQKVSDYMYRHRIDPRRETRADLIAKHPYLTKLLWDWAITGQLFTLGRERGPRFLHRRFWAETAQAP